MDWSSKHLSPDGQGVAFNGNSCKKLLNNINTLEELIDGHPLGDELDKVVDAFSSFKEVTELCFGMELKSGYALAIDRFMDYYRQIENLNASIKVHILEAHVCDFFERQKGTELTMKERAWVSGLSRHQNLFTQTLKSTGQSMSGTWTTLIMQSSSKSVGSVTIQTICKDAIFSIHSCMIANGLGFPKIESCSITFNY